MTEIQAALDKLLEWGNRWREATHQRPLDQLPEGIPCNASQCLVARTFNLNCEVLYQQGSGRYFHPGSGRILFNEEMATATLFAMKFNEVFDLEPDTNWSCRLPDDIAHLAFLFDQGRLPDYDEQLLAERAEMEREEHGG